MYSSRMSDAVSTVMTINPARSVRGRLRVPGDKSISHRYAILAALADGTSTIQGYAPGTDCQMTLECLRALGVSVDCRTTSDGALPIITVRGRGLGGFLAPADQLNAGNSGTTLRLLSGVLAAHRFETVFTGDASLRRRPMQRIIEPLQRMGAEFEAVDNRPPVTIRGSHLHGINYVPTVASAQVKSAVLLAGLHATGTTRVHERIPTRDHTERALPVFGLEVRRDANGVTVTGGCRLSATTLTVPGDVSSAAFWAVAAAALPHSDVEIESVGLNPTRTAFLDVLRRAGANVDVRIHGTVAGEPVGSVRVRNRQLARLVITPSEVPALIDELPVLAALATHGEEIEVSGAQELRYKESDRIAALATGLCQLGANFEERADGFRVEKRGILTGGTVDAAGDHRLAMAFTIAALGASGPSVITGTDVVDVSYPGFFKALDSLRQ